MTSSEVSRDSDKVEPVELILRSAVQWLIEKRAALKTERDALQFELTNAIPHRPFVAASHPLFDASFYLSANPDVRDSGANPLDHYIRNGAMELRAPNKWFDPRWYRERYLNRYGMGIDPVRHYLDVGAALGYDPSPRFRTREYLAANADVASAGLNPLVHFMVHGQSEGRQLRQPESRNDGSFLVVTPRHTLYLAHLYADTLQSFGYPAEVATETTYQDCFEHVIVFCPNHYPDMRFGSIAYQLEQTTNLRWFNGQYVSTLFSASAIIDYADANREFLSRLGLDRTRIVVLPIAAGAVDTYDDPDDGDRESFDLLFYGDDQCERRQEYLKALSVHFSVKVVCGKYGPEMWSLIKRAKIVLNIHYYDPAILEVVRLYECLSLGALVVSERATDSESYPELDDAILFVDCGNINQMVDAIRNLLSDDARKRTLRCAGQRLVEVQQAKFRTGFKQFLQIYFERDGNKNNDDLVIDTVAPLMSAPKLPDPAAPSVNGHAQRILELGLFDADWYCQRVPDADPADPLTSFMTVGLARGDAPGPEFDPAIYLKRYPDVAGSGMNPLLHYIQYGYAEGRNPHLPKNVRNVVPRVISELADIDDEIASDDRLIQYMTLEVGPSSVPPDILRVWSAIYHALPQTYDNVLFVGSKSNEMMKRLETDAESILVASERPGEFENGGARVQFDRCQDRNLWDFLNARPTSTLLVSTEASSGENAQTWANLPRVDLATISGLTPDDRVRIVEMLIYALRPVNVVSLASEACTAAFIGRGLALTQASKLSMVVDPDNQVLRPAQRPDLRRLLTVLDRLFVVAPKQRSDLRSNSLFRRIIDRVSARNRMA